MKKTLRLPLPMPEIVWPLPTRRQLLRRALGAAVSWSPPFYSIALAALSQSACKPRTTVMPIDTSQWKPLVFGRFMMRAPQDAISYGSYYLWTDQIERSKDITSRKLL